MKLKFHPRLPWFVLVLVSFLALHPSSFAQGPLTPPGPPAPTFKTLQQVEPRTAITNLPYTINAPGSYYLTTNLTGVAGADGITINASGVTLDLMGFELVGAPGSIDGVVVTANRTNSAVRNGTVRNWGDNGVNVFDSPNGQYQDLRLTANGLKGLSCGPNSTVVNCKALNNGGGISAGTGSRVEDCTVSSNTGDGIFTGDGCTVSGCTAHANTGNGILTGDGSLVSGCTAVSNTVYGIAAGNGNTVSGCCARFNQHIGINVGFGSTVKECSVLSNVNNGIFTANDCTVTSCTVRRNDATGIFANAGSTVSECTVGFNGFDGIQVASSCLVRHNNCAANGRLIATGAGILASGGQSRIDDNNVTGNDRGIDVDLAGNIIIRNTASANTDNYGQIVAGNTVGPIIAGTNPITTTNPWANFSY